MNADLSTNIKTLCHRKKWQLRDLANAMGVDPAALTRAMRGNPTLETIEKMASALGVPPSRLIQRQSDISGYITIDGNDIKFTSIKELEDILGASIVPKKE